MFLGVFLSVSLISVSNVSADNLDTSTVSQTKAGSLTAKNLIATGYVNAKNIIATGYLNVGSFFMSNGKGLGKILTSDANGVGTWSSNVSGNIFTANRFCLGGECIADWSEISSLVTAPATTNNSTDPSYTKVTATQFCLVDDSHCITSWPSPVITMGPLQGPLQAVPSPVVAQATTPQVVSFSKRLEIYGGHCTARGKYYGAVRGFPYQICVDTDGTIYRLAPGGGQTACFDAATNSNANISNLTTTSTSDDTQVQMEAVCSVMRVEKVNGSWINYGANIGASFMGVLHFSLDGVSIMRFTGGPQGETTPTFFLFWE